MRVGCCAPLPSSLRQIFSLLYVLCLENGWVSEKAEGTVLLIFAGVYAWVSWRLMRMGYVSDRFGFRSYPMILLETSGLLMMVLVVSVSFSWSSSASGTRGRVLSRESPSSFLGAASLRLPFLLCRGWRGWR